MIYLDHNATTPLLPQVKETLKELFGEEYGNPSSPYQTGRRARDLLEATRPIHSGAGQFTNFGTSGDDNISGGDAGDVLEGQTGNDTIAGLGGAVICLTHSPEPEPISIIFFSLKS